MDFPFAEGYILYGHFVQYLRAKQRTVVLTKRPPPYPGKKPLLTDNPDYSNWKKKADRYARYYLSEYRAEVDCYEPNHVNTYEYDWEALEKWIAELRADDDILSKCCLLVMHTRMQGFQTKFKTKVMLAQY